MKSNFHFMPALAGVFLLAGAQAASATVLLYNDFSSAAGLQINGNASAPVTDDMGRKVLRLTPATTGQSGSTFSTSAVSLASSASFSSAFRFRITSSGGICDSDGCGADGIVFAVQTVSNTAGGAGGGIGYYGLSNSVGIEFDTWDNGWWDGYDGNHVGVDISGDINSAARAHVGNRMNNGDVWSAWVDYDGALDKLEVRLAMGEAASRPLNPYLDYNVDLAAVLGTTNAYVGFTAGTGSAYGNHDILAWQFNSTYSPITDIGGGATVPEPTTLALMGVAMAGLVGVRRKQRK